MVFEGCNTLKTAGLLSMATRTSLDFFPWRLGLAWTSFHGIVLPTPTQNSGVQGGQRFNWCIAIDAVIQLSQLSRHPTH